MKIFFGGSFDPVHNGHLALAVQIATEFDHKVSFMPLTGNPNYKAPPKASLKDRLAMLELIINLYPAQLEIDYHETAYSEYSPTYHSLTRLRKVYGDDEPFYFVIGGDSLVNLTVWDCWQKLFNLTNFIVARREDYPLEMMPEDLKQEVIPRIDKFNGQHSPCGKIYFSNFTPVEISSTMIRNRVSNLLPVNNLIADKVNQYIINHNLYQGK